MKNLLLLLIYLNRQEITRKLLSLNKLFHLYYEIKENNPTKGLLTQEIDLQLTQLETQLQDFIEIHLRQK